MLYHLTSIPEKDILRFALAQNPPEPIPEELSAQAAAAAEKILLCTPLYHYMITETEPLLREHFSGKDLRRNLQDCEKSILLCATLGPQADTMLRRAQITDMAKALWLDAAASAAIEEVCDQIQVHLSQTLGRSLTPRFSCGYGDFPLSQQKDFLALTNAGSAIGLSVSSGGMLIPVKSVTAVMGILPEGASPRQAQDPCSLCPMNQTCLLRRKGVSCGKYADRLA